MEADGGEYGRKAVGCSCLRGGGRCPPWFSGDTAVYTDRCICKSDRNHCICNGSGIRGRRGCCKQDNHLFQSCKYPDDRTVFACVSQDDSYLTAWESKKSQYSGNRRDPCPGQKAKDYALWNPVFIIRFHSFLLLPAGVSGDDNNMSVSGYCSWPMKHFAAELAMNSNACFSSLNQALIRGKIRYR